MKLLTRLVKTMLSVLGFEVRRTRYIPAPPERLAANQLVAAMKKFEVDLVLDVGANIGQFSSELRRGGYGGKIVSFEPLSQAHAQLTRERACDPAWVVHPRCALGDHEGETEINIAGNSQSSSILPMLELHRRVAPDSAYQGKETSAIHRLDAVAARYIEDAKAPFLKIDTQGYEWQVLDGACAVLPRIQGILIEMSLAPLYDGQRLWRDILCRLEAEGFVLWAFRPVFSEPETGRTLQVDGIFFRIPAEDRRAAESRADGEAA